MTRWEMAEAYRKKSFNCAQCVLLSFGDLTGLTEEKAKAIAGGMRRSQWRSAGAGIASAPHPG